METTASLSQNKVFCPIRKEWVRLTPEERVRVSTLSSLLAKGFPASLIVVERKISELPHLLSHPKRLPNRRVDILCYSANILPLLLIECKSSAFSSKEMRQLFGYNVHIGARFALLVSGEKWHFSDARGQEIPLQGSFPSYSSLL